MMQFNIDSEPHQVVVTLVDEDPDTGVETIVESRTLDPSSSILWMQTVISHMWILWTADKTRPLPRIKWNHVRHLPAIFLAPSRPLALWE